MPRCRQANSSRLPSLDGWRALSIALVLGAHSIITPGFPPALRTTFTWLFDGDLGVRFFFIISGFLITWLITLENDHIGRVNLKQFYIRRALRILPVYFAFMLVLAGLQHFTPYTQSGAVWAGNLTFTTNFIGCNWPSAHLWTLAVEEQFYLLWPCLFVFCHIAAGGYRRAVLVLALPVLLAPACRVISYLHWHPAILGPAFTPHSFFNYCDSLAVGCACAIMLARKPGHVQWLCQAHFKSSTTVAILLILTPYVLCKLSLLGIITVPLGNAMQAWGFAILLLQSVTSPAHMFYRMLNWSWFCQIGVLSYSIYIWQQIFCTKVETFGLGNVWWMSYPGWLVAVIVTATGSYYGLEKPMLKLRARFR
jgi:peptidoglycan/LPS O-acetylase OafA/YrhL